MGKFLIMLYNQNIATSANIMNPGLMTRNLRHSWPHSNAKKHTRGQVQVWKFLQQSKYGKGQLRGMKVCGIGI